MTAVVVELCCGGVVTELRVVAPVDLRAAVEGLVVVTLGLAVVELGMRVVAVVVGSGWPEVVPVVPVTALAFCLCGFAELAAPRGALVTGPRALTSGRLRGGPMVVEVA